MGLWTLHEELLFRTTVPRSCDSWESTVAITNLGFLRPRESRLLVWARDGGRGWPALHTQEDRHPSVQLTTLRPTAAPKTCTLGISL